MRLFSTTKTDSEIARELSKCTEDIVKTHKLYTVNPTEELYIKGLLLIERGEVLKWVLNVKE